MSTMNLAFSDFSHGRAAVGTTQLHYRAAGEGDAVILLHGWPQHSLQWHAISPRLDETHRVIVPDLRGHGRSVPGTSGFSWVPAPGPVAELRADARMAAAQQGSPGVRRMAADVRAVLATLEVEHALVVGHSMGGMVALQLVHDLEAEELRRRVAGLALVSTTAGPFTRLPGLGGMARVARPISARAVSLADRLGVSVVASQDLRWWLTRLGFGADAPPPQVRFVEGMHLATPSATVVDLLPSLAMFDLSKWLGSVDLPVLVVVGSHDRLTPPRHALRTAAALAHSELVELPRCGHMPMIERRREFTRLIEEFAAKID